MPTPRSTNGDNITRLTVKTPTNDYHDSLHPAANICQHWPDDARPVPLTIHSLWVNGEEWVRRSEVDDIIADQTAVETSEMEQRIDQALIDTHASTFLIGADIGRPDERQVVIETLMRWVRVALGP